MLGFELDFWDYATFATVFAAGLAVLVFAVWVAGLPGRIAIARKHPEAEAVGLMGYAGFLSLVPWFKAFIWAFKPTDVVDIRRFPAAEALATEEELSRLRGEPVRKWVKRRAEVKAAAAAEPAGTPPDPPAHG